MSVNVGKEKVMCLGLQQGNSSTGMVPFSSINHLWLLHGGEKETVTDHAQTHTLGRDWLLCVPLHGTPEDPFYPYRLLPLPVVPLSGTEMVEVGTVRRSRHLHFFLFELRVSACLVLQIRLPSVLLPLRCLLTPDTLMA